MRTRGSVLLRVMAAAASADDEVKLKNGDRLAGKVVGMSGGKLIVETGYAVPLKIDWAQVVSVKSDVPIKVTLATGELLQGKLAPGAEGRLKVETQGAAARVEADLAKVKALNEPPTQWHGNITAAGKLTEGNTRTKSFLISAEGSRETEQDVLLLRAIFHSGMPEGVLTERNSYGLGKYPYKFTPALYGYLSQELVSDTFKDMDLESITSLGGGLHLANEPWIDWSLEASVAVFNFSDKTAPDEARLGARLVEVPDGVAAGIRV